MIFGILSHLAIALPIFEVAMKISTFFVPTLIICSTVQSSRKNQPATRTWLCRGQSSDCSQRGRWTRRPSGTWPTTKNLSHFCRLVTRELGGLSVTIPMCNPHIYIYIYIQQRTWFFHWGLGCPPTQRMWRTCTHQHLAECHCRTCLRRYHHWHSWQLLFLRRNDRIKKV